MKTPNHSKTLIKPLLIAAGLATAVAATAWATELPDAVVSASAGDATATDRPVDPESVARANWRTLMAHNSAPATGCYHASYPTIVWEKVACKIGQPRVHPVHARPRADVPEVTGGIGNGKSDDYVAEGTGLITEAVGSFAISGVTSEVGVSEYNINGVQQGITGSNEYSIQLNTNEFETTSACAGHGGCTVWQQFIYATDYLGPGEAEVFMQYWLLDWGSTACPSGWNQSGHNCWANSFLVAVDDLPITDLGSMAITASATAGGNDTVVFTWGSDAVSSSFPDYVVDISSVWDKAEFNVVGNGGGARANFNAGSSVTVTIFLIDGSNVAPKCVANDGSTGESNNLNAGPCAAYNRFVYRPPSIKFTESN